MIHQPIDTLPDRTATLLPFFSAAGAAIDRFLFWVPQWSIAGALIVLLLWVYYSAQIFLLGAEFTKVYANSHGSKQGAPVSEHAPSPST